VPRSAAARRARIRPSSHAWKCQHRLFKVFHRLAAKKPKQVAATAVAREMVGFLWATLTELDIAALQHSEVSRAA
jgi:hypothetical protein